MEQPPEQKIHQMDDVLASQVAAGEVVERPSSVLKELVENSIDAGARCIRVEIRRGGIALIKVTDDGCGMSRIDAELCLRRHATSKLRCAEDLFDIHQLGFRGEALPSIASVSRLLLRTRRAEDIEGIEVRSDGGAEPEISSTGCAPGTEISISDLFYNTPVRRKFLKSEETEAGHIEHQLRLHALAYPQLRFVLVKDGALSLDLPATGDLRQRIAGFIGREQAERLIPMQPYQGPGVRVSGYLMPLSEARRNRRMQYIFLNGRPIEDKIITRAIRDGYGGFPTGLHPSLFLYLEVDPGLVDVNVHPAKREVRFRRPSDITLAVLGAVGSTLAAQARGEMALNTPPGASSATRPPTGPTLSPRIDTAATGTSSGNSPTLTTRLVLQSLIQPRQQHLPLQPGGSAALTPSEVFTADSGRGVGSQQSAAGGDAGDRMPSLQGRGGAGGQGLGTPSADSATPSVSAGEAQSAAAAGGATPCSPRSFEPRSAASAPGVAGAARHDGYGSDSREGRVRDTSSSFPSDPGSFSALPMGASYASDVLPRFRYIGCLHGRYLLYENTEVLVLMSPTAARERIIFERLLESHRRPLTSQRLLHPIMLEPDARDWGVVQQLLPHFERSGFIVSLFGQRTLRVEAIPALLPLDDTEAFIDELIAWYARGEGRTRRSRNPFEPFATQLAHQYAMQEDMDIWIGQPMPLLVDLLRCEIPYCTPTGRPTLVPFSLSELDRKFQAR